VLTDFGKSLYKKARECKYAVLGNESHSTQIQHECGILFSIQINIIMFKQHISFFCDGVFYRQIQGAPMGSPVSPAVADLTNENFEDRALKNAPVTPSVW
jgi:hypothetical protein